MAVESLTLELGLEDPHGAVLDDEPQSGLGRSLDAILSAAASERPRRGGLASLIPETLEPLADEPAAPPLVAPPTLAHGGELATSDLRADLVRALMDGLGSSMPLDLCVYLHQSRTERATLTMRSPAFSSLDPSDAFALCDLLGRRLRQGRSGAFEAAGYVGTTVFTAGWASGGVYAVGRRRGLLGAPEIAAVESFCTTLGASIHQLSEQHDDPGPLPELRVHVDEAALGAEATVGVITHDGLRTGHAWAGGRVEAVAAALLKAIDRSRMFRYASEAVIDGERQALALLQGDDGTTALRGASVRTGGPGAAVALATWKAAAALM